VSRIDELLAEARAGLRRMSPQEAAAAVAACALLVDTRTAAHRARQGSLPGAIVIDRTVFEWRLDPTSPHRIPEVTGHDVLVVVVCREGFSSSLAAASLQRLGLHRATDVVGGLAAWRRAGLPMA